MSFILTFLEGIIAFVSPCILPMLPVYLIYLAGGKQGQGKKLILNTLAFIFGFTTIFVLMGATATGIGRFLIREQRTIQILGGIIMVLLGLWYLDLPFLQKFKMRWARPQSDRARDRHLEKEVHIGSAYLFGAAYSLTWGPCLSTWLSAALILASQEQTLARGMLLLFLFSMGLGLPFLLTAVLFEQLKGVLDKIKKHMDTIKRISGIILILVGMMQILGFFVWFQRLFNY